jgi:RNA polymerase sigma-70 factor (ECF subfamily)
MLSERDVLDQISTRWPLISEPRKFVLRYATAIRRYLGAILRDDFAVDEVTQELMVRLLEKPIVPTQITRGRFRDYLKVMVRNTALTWLRREKNRAPASSDLLDTTPDRHDDPQTKAEKHWNEEWKRCLLERVFDDLDLHERENPQSRCHRVMKLTIELGDEYDSTELASKLSKEVGETIKPEAFRKQVSRAKRLFVRYLLREVARTLEQVSIAALEEELADLELLSLIEPWMPQDWRERGDLLDL